MEYSIENKKLRRADVHEILVKQMKIFIKEYEQKNEGKHEEFTEEQEKMINEKLMMRVEVMIKLNMIIF